MSFSQAGWYYWEKEPGKSTWTKCHWIDGFDLSGVPIIACGKKNGIARANDLIPGQGDSYSCKICMRRVRQRTAI
jgi:hypothetical protein